MERQEKIKRLLRKTTDELLKKVEDISTKNIGGSLKIVRFTNHYKGLYGYDKLDGIEDSLMWGNQEKRKTLKELLVYMIVEPQNHIYTDKLIELYNKKWGDECHIDERISVLKEYVITEGIFKNK